MRIIEQFLQSKTGKEGSCEDGYIVTDCFAAVIDGVTNKNGMEISSSSPGKIAMQLAKEAIANLPPTTSAREAFHLINHAVYAYYRQRGLVETMQINPSLRYSASSVMYSATRRELWFLGDCMALANGTVYQFHKEADRVLADLRSLLIHIERSRGISEESLMDHDICRERIMEFLNRQTLLQNSSYASPFTYYVIDGISEEAPNHAIIIPIDRNTREIVLASDGYPALYPTLAQTEEHLARILAIDPLCYREFRSTKGLTKGNVSFDDRTYIRLSI